MPGAYNLEDNTRSSPFVPVSYSLLVLRNKKILANKFYANAEGIGEHLLDTLDALWTNVIKPILHAREPMDEECRKIKAVQGARCHLCTKTITGIPVRDHSHRYVIQYVLALLRPAHAIHTRLMLIF